MNDRAKGIEAGVQAGLEAEGIALRERLGSHVDSRPISMGIVAGPHSYSQRRTIHNFGSAGFEHVEEAAWRTGTTDIEFRSDTYGDADSVEIDVSNLANAQIVVDGTIDSFVKVGDPLQGNPFALTPAKARLATARDRVRAECGRLGIVIGDDL